MTFDDHLNDVVQRAVAQAIAPLARKIEELSSQRERNLSLAETAASLGLGLRTVERMVKSGAIESHKIGGRRVVPAAALAAFRAQQ